MPSFIFKQPLFRRQNCYILKLCLHYYVYVEVGPSVYIFVASSNPINHKPCSGVKSGNLAGQIVERKTAVTNKTL